MAHLWPKSLDTQMLENQKCEHAAFSKKEYVVYLGIDRLWEGCKLSPGWFGANFPSVKILDFRSAKVFARMVCGKKGPKVLGAPQDEATAWRNGANFLDCTFQPLLRLFSQVGVSIVSKRMKNTQHEKTASKFLSSSAHLDNTSKKIFSILKNDF